MPDRIKALLSRYREEVSLALVILIVAFLSFSLGRLSVGGDSPLPRVLGESQVKAPSQDLPAREGEYVASKTGSVYYPASCKLTSRVPKGEAVYFATSAEAEASGYRPSAACAPYDTTRAR